MTTTTLRQLDIFAQMVASESIVDCARTLGVSPATVESDMHALEERLGFQLFFVDGRSIKLTPAGRKAVAAMAQLSSVESTPTVSLSPPDAANDLTDPVEEGVAPDKEDVPSDIEAPDAIAEIGLAEEAAEQDELLLAEESVLELEGESEEAVAALDPFLTEAVVDDRAALDASAESMASPVEEAIPPASQDSGELELTNALPVEEALPEPKAFVQAPAIVRVNYATSMSRPATWFARGQSIRVSSPPVMEAPRKPDETVVAAPLPRPAEGERAPARPLPEPPPAAEELAEPARQQVTIAAHPSIFSHFQDMLAAFEQGNADVAIRLDLGAFTASTVAARFAAGDVDIAYFHAVGDPDELQSRYVWSERLSLYVGADHPLAERDQVGAQDMLLSRPALLAADNPLRPLIERALRKAGLDSNWPAMESDDVFQLLNAVRGGLGYFAAFGPLARDFGKMDGIRRLPFVDPLPPVEIRQAVREEMMDDPVVSSLAEYLFR